MLPRERPAAARRRGRSGSSGAPIATTGSCSRPPSGSASRSAATATSSRPARRTTATAPSRPSTDSMRWAVDRAAASLPSEADAAMSTASTEAAQALREALGDDRVRDGDSERDLHAERPQLPRTAPPRPRCLSGLDRRGGTRARARERARDPGDALRRRHEPRGSRDPGARRHQPRPLATRPDPRDLAREPDSNGAGGGDATRRSNGRRASTASPSRSTRAPTQRSAAWPPRTPPARQRCATGRCARTRWRSRRCWPTGA